MNFFLKFDKTEIENGTGLKKNRLQQSYRSIVPSQSKKRFNFDKLPDSYKKKGSFEGLICDRLRETILQNQENISCLNNRLITSENENYRDNLKIVRNSTLTFNNQTRLFTIVTTAKCCNNFTWRFSTKKFANCDDADKIENWLLVKVVTKCNNGKQNFITVHQRKKYNFLFCKQKVNRQMLLQNSLGKMHHKYERYIRKLVVKFVTMENHSLMIASRLSMSTAENIWNRQIQTLMVVVQHF